MSSRATTSKTSSRSSTGDLRSRTTSPPPALADFADIFGLDGDFVAAAASGDTAAPTDPSPGDIERWLAGIRPDEHVAWLARVARGDGSVGAELMRRFRRHTPRHAAALPLHTAGELRASAEGIAEQRRQAK